LLPDYKTLFLLLLSSFVSSFLLSLAQFFIAIITLCFYVLLQPSHTIVRTCVFDVFYQNQMIYFKRITCKRVHTAPQYVEKNNTYLTTFRKNKMLEKETFAFLPFLFLKKLSLIHGNIKLFL